MTSWANSSAAVPDHHEILLSKQDWRAELGEAAIKHDVGHSNSFGRKGSRDYDDRYERRPSPPRDYHRDQRVPEPQHGQEHHMRSPPISPEMHPRQAGAGKPSPFGAARPREVVIAQKHIPDKLVEVERRLEHMELPPAARAPTHDRAVPARVPDHGEPMATSPISSPPSRARKSNPFGDARPREENLAAKHMADKEKEVEERLARERAAAVSHGAHHPREHGGHGGHGHGERGAPVDFGWSGRERGGSFHRERDDREANPFEDDGPIRRNW